MRRSRHPFVKLIVVGVVIALVVVVARKHYWPAPQPADTRPADKPANGEPATRGTLIPPPIGTMPVDVKTTPADRAKALSLLEQGVGFLKQRKLLDARAALADAMNTSALPAEQAEAVRTKLAELANKMIFSREVVKGDPCAFWYRFQSGDVLVKVAPKLKLHVPAQLIQEINGIADARTIQVGQVLKMIRGPFHAVVSKSRFIMDIFLEEPQTHRMIFVKRFGVGVGKDGSTPTGRWRVVRGGKITNAPWTPPASSNLERKPIEWGQPGYPFGPKGYWISLEGTGKTPYTREDGYGIHGTNDPSSIGKASSLGCIRLGDNDIEMLFAMLYDKGKWSTVTILP